MTLEYCGNWLVKCKFFFLIDVVHGVAVIVSQAPLSCRLRRVIYSCCREKSVKVHATTPEVVSRFQVSLFKEI